MRPKRLTALAAAGIVVWSVVGWWFLKKGAPMAPPTALLGIVLSVGLWFRQSWARVACLSLSWLTAVLYVVAFVVTMPRLRAAAEVAQSPDQPSLDLALAGLVLIYSPIFLLTIATIVILGSEPVKKAFGLPGKAA